VRAGNVGRDKVLFFFGKRGIVEKREESFEEKG